MDGIELIRSTRGLTRKIAEELGISSPAISQWDRVPAERVPEIERITGIPRYLLRPDLWQPPPEDLGL